MVELTQEQDEIVAAVKTMPTVIPPISNGVIGEILLVPAGAGCGKTFISKEVVDNIKPSNGLYTAFNKAIVEEGEERFRGTNMECKTIHALAYKYVKPGRSIETLSYNCITESITYSDKAIVLDTIDLFFVSSSSDMYDFIDEELSNDQNDLKELCCKYIELMMDGKLAPSFNYLLKRFHLLLLAGDITCKYDIVILDEINDTTAVALEIFKLIDSPKKLGLGETHQAIYKFLNLKDGFEELKDAKQLPLSYSFRCSEKIADGIQKFMQTHVTSEFNFHGTYDPVKNGKTLEVTSTNAAIIIKIQEYLSLGKRFTLLRKISEIFAYPMAISTASTGKQVYQRKYKFLEKEYKNFKAEEWKHKSFLSYLLSEVGDQETKSAANLLMYLSQKNINLFTLYNNAKAIKPDPKFTISTVFTSKGLEYETVNINDDMNNRISGILDNGGIQSEEDLVAFRCYYVACSRCGTNLNNAKHLDVL